MVELIEYSYKESRIVIIVTRYTFFSTAGNICAYRLLEDYLFSTMSSLKKHEKVHFT